MWKSIRPPRRVAPLARAPSVALDHAAPRLQRHASALWREPGDVAQDRLAVVREIRDATAERLEASYDREAPLSRAHARTREGLRPPSGEAVTVGLAALGPVTYHAGSRLRRRRRHPRGAGCSSRSAVPSRRVSERHSEHQGDCHGKDPPGSESPLSEEGGETEPDGDAHCDTPVVADDEVPPEGTERADVPHAVRPRPSHPPWPTSP